MIKNRLHIVWFLILAAACGKKSAEDHTNHSGPDSTKVNQAILQISHPSNQVVLSSQKTIKLSQNPSKQTVTASGYIAFDERRNNLVAVRTSARIERLYVKYNYQYVKRGERIAELYSPELNTYQEEYLFLLQSGEASLAAKAKHKLKLLGLSENQIQQVEKSGTVTNTIIITSPIDGFIRFSEAPASQAEMKPSSKMVEMNVASASNAEYQIISSDQIREGAYITKGQTLFVVNDARHVWVILSFDIDSQRGLKIGSSITLYPEGQLDSIKAKIDLAEPIYQNKQRFAQARIYLDNPHRKLKINSLVRSKVVVQSDALSIPLSSVYDLGSRKIVWVKTDTTSTGIGLFEPRTVITGMSSDNSIVIINGLQGDEEIALDAGYMQDSESILRENP
ncbi:MAG: efflux RND transporter periplasmic adaptor subunit [Chryseolinea sp.]